MTENTAPTAQPHPWHDAFCEHRATAVDGGFTHGPCAQCDDPAFIAYEAELDSEAEATARQWKPDYDTRHLEAPEADGPEAGWWLGPLHRPQRRIVSVGLDGRSQPMWRYRDELHLPDHQRSIVAPEDRP